jgi:Ca-activated chloride channel family protein
MNVSFANPDAFWLLALVLAVAVLLRLGDLRRRRALALVGQPGAVVGLVMRRRAGRTLARFGMLLVPVLLAVGLAGPRWGKGDETGVVKGRDLVIVLDLSKSMLGEDMADPTYRARWQAARRGLLELVDAVERRGGHRLGLVVFAARPWVLCPLTADYDHVRLRLDECDPGAPPTEVYPKPDEPFESGTRMGEALRLAVAVHDARFPGHQDILLVSDGDDPRADNEWQKGVAAAAAAGIPVHVVGLGDPADGALIAGGDVVSILDEKPLREIARLTRGEYFPARREVPKLGEFFTGVIEPRPSRELSDDVLPRPGERYIWLLLPALAVMALAWWLEGRR